MIRPTLNAGALVAGLLLSTTAIAQDMPGEGVSVQPIKATPVNAWLWNQVVALGLGELGYDVEEMREADFPVLHLAVGQGDADFTANNWKPLHDAYFDRAGADDTMVRVGPITTGAGQGYYIDEATADEYGITNLGQLKDPEIAKLFDSDGDGRANLAGCNPGWGCEGVIEHQLDEFDLRDTVQHDQGSYYAIIADVLTRHENGDPILYYTWTPNWVGDVLVPGENTAPLNVPYSSMPNDPDVDTELPDGTNPGFVVNEIYILANRDFYEANPAAATFMEQVKIPLADVNAVQVKIRNGADSSEDFLNQAQTWIDDNRDTVDGWLEKARAAAK
ncbi:glycine betaine/L-proline ABC transporter substrate-binding protein ProX [Oceaniglobus trochenteri]|uniref:glycine betaine/L-proline ABC transporter substrate-binding protein ProX n=1 Tax=Oceaniglobus trochenteri TaxID=2763260 RepID=UPI001CFF61DD|nr:glycine betaine/L-proline ABC transporter substrate-binding protein ProX [Oceaniglobus trochenteri]